jgi:hypothetical protein
VKIAVAACRQRCIEDCSAGIADRTTGRQFGTSISFGDTDHRASAVSGIDMVAERSQGHASAVTTWLRRSVEGLEVGVGVGEFVTRRTTSNQRHPIQVFRHKGTIEQRILERLPEDKELKKKEAKKKVEAILELAFWGVPRRRIGRCVSRPNCRGKAAKAGCPHQHDRIKLISNCLVGASHQINGDSQSVTHK